MIELEDRLRATLTELAGNVPASQHPKDDFERRLAARRRRPLLVAAAAVVLVIAGVAVPMVFDGTPPVDRPAAPDIVEATGHHVLGTFTENGTTYQADAGHRRARHVADRARRRHARFRPTAAPAALPHRTRGRDA